jgi:hypothetical protein
VSRRLVNLAATVTGGTILTFTWVSDGNLGTAGTTLVSATGGSGSGATFNITRSGAGNNRPVSSVTLVSGGTGYTVGDSLIASDAASDVTITVSTVST